MLVSLLLHLKLLFTPIPDKIFKLNTIKRTSGVFSINCLYHSWQEGAAPYLVEPVSKSQQAKTKQFKIISNETQLCQPQRVYESSTKQDYSKSVIMFPNNNGPIVIPYANNTN